MALKDWKKKEGFLEWINKKRKEIVKVDTTGMRDDSGKLTYKALVEEYEKTPEGTYRLSEIFTITKGLDKEVGMFLGLSKSGAIERAKRYMRNH